MQNVDARRLAAECLSRSHPQRWRHVQGVAARAALLSSPGRGDVVVTAAWVHDIGYAPAAAATGFHALDGATFLAELGMDQLVVSLVAFHTGAEIEAEERGLVHELNRFARPPQDLLDSLILCDLTVSPTGTGTDVVSRIEEIMTRYGVDHPVHRAVRRSSDYLQACCARAATDLSAEERGIAVF